MTHEEWLVCEDWRPMLAILAGRWTQRKAWLYICGGLRQVWDLLYDKASREAVETAERAADGEASIEDMRDAAYGAECPTFGFDFSAAYIRDWKAKSGYYTSGVQTLLEMGVFTERDLQGDERLGDERTRSRLIDAAYIAHTNLYGFNAGNLNNHLVEYLSRLEEWPGGGLLRELFGNPFRLLAFDSTWLAWNGGIIRRIAQTIYDERSLPDGTLDAARLAVLADALEEAGCTDADILSHLRSSGSHVRGCWALDLILGKQ